MARKKIGTESMGRTSIRAHRENSHGEQIQVTSVVLSVIPILVQQYCSNAGYVIVVNCGYNWLG